MEKKWYVLHSMTGQEKKVKKLIEQAIKERDLSHYFGGILIPVERVSRVVGNERKIIEKVVYPGYILIEMELNETTLELITSIPGIMTLLGSKTELHSLTQEEIERVFSYTEKAKMEMTTEVSFRKGDNVKVIDGPFTDFTGVVDEIYSEREKLKVMVTIFGRSTPVELGFAQVQPI